MSDDTAYWLILAGAGTIFFTVMGWGIYKDHRDEKEGKKG